METKQLKKEKFTQRIVDSVGYLESQDKAEVMKGALIARFVMEEYYEPIILEMQNKINRINAQIEHKQTLIDNFISAFDALSP